VAKQYRTLAYQLYEGSQVCLRKLILGCLYESLNQGVANMRNCVKSLFLHTHQTVAAKMKERGPTELVFCQS